MTFNRQVLSAVFSKEMMDDLPFSKDVIKRSHYYLDNIGLDVGAYSES